MSINCSHSAFNGPTLRKRSFENLFIDTSHFPSASAVSPIEVELWPGWYCTSTFEMIGSSPATALAMFHFTTWLSRNNVVKALPCPSKAV